MAKKASQRLFDSQVMHSIGLKRLEKTEAKKICSFIEKAEGDLFKQIADKQFITGGINRQTRKQLNRLLVRVGLDHKNITNRSFKMLRKSMRSLATFEYAFQARQLKNAFKGIVPIAVVSTRPEILYTAVFSNPFQGSPLSEWATGFNNSQIEKIKRATRLSFYQGEGQAGLKTRLIGSRTTSGVLKTACRQGEAIARTALNHSANQARDVFHRNNRLSNKYRYTSVIDGRTTLICSSRDGEVFKLGSRPTVPAHIQCRSIYIQILDENAVIGGDRQTVTSTLTRKKLRAQWRKQAKLKGTSVSSVRKKWVKDNIGKTPGKTTYSQWLKGQSPAFQKEYLGPSRYKLFDKGNLDLNDFLDKKTGSLINLKGLKLLEPKAFKLANI